MAKNEVLKHYFPDDADKVEHTEEFHNTNEPLASQEYGGEWRHINTPPQYLRELLKVETRDNEREAIKRALQWWDSKKSDVEMGEPYRGEPRPDKKVENLKDLVGENGKVEHITPRPLIPREIDESDLEIEL